MKKLIVAILALALPTLVFAYFQPATLTKGAARVAVYTEGQAKALFAQGYKLETKAPQVGGFYSPDILGPVNKFTNIAQTLATSTVNLNVRDSETTYLLSASGTTIVLPAVAGAKGTTYRFVVNGAIANGNMIIAAAGANDIEGSVIVAGAVVDCNAAQYLTFVTDGENIGDYVEIMSTGTYWVPLSSGVLTSAKLTCSG